MAQVPRLGRGLRQAGRRPVGRRRSPRARGSRQDAARDRDRRRPTSFYKGWIADRIADDMEANGGLITKADLAAYQAKERAPVKGTFRGYEIVSMPPPSSGGVALIEMLNMLEALRPEGEGLADRAGAAPRRSKRCAAPTSIARASSAIPTSCRCRSPGSRRRSTRRRSRRRSIRRRRAAASSSARTSSPPPAQEPDETTHFSVIDRHGMAVSEHLHARRRLRLARRRQGRRLPPEQRDGGLQQEARRDATPTATSARRRT